MAARSKGLWASEGRWACWEAAAELAGLSLNGWLVRAADGRAELELALRRQGVRDGEVKGEERTDDGPGGC